MNRRDFMGSLVAGAAAASGLPLPSASAEGVTESLPRARWLSNGIIDAGGDHEPLVFVVRRGGASLEAARKRYEMAQSEEVIRRLKDQGVELFHTHLYKGFGMAAEREAMEDTRRTAAIAHRYGMKVDTYIQWNTMMYETFFAEEPRARDWIQRDIQGLPILLTYGFQQSFRYRPCFANQEYLEYLKKIVRFAVEEVKTDFIHFDNFDLNPEPDSCHCPACVQGFRKHLRGKYTPAQRLERFGFENVDFVNPPQWNRQNRPEKMEIIFDPALQEWIDFRCQLMADALRQMALYAKSLNSEVAIEINPHGITGGNRPWEAAIDHTRLLKWTEVFWTEEENQPSFLPDGRLISKIRSYKLARRFNNRLLTYIADDPVAMAECLSFNQTIGFAGSDPLPPEMLKYISFYRRNRELYLDTEDLAPVGVLRSYPSLTYHHSRSQLSAILVEQALIQARMPFGLIFDNQFGDLSQCRVLVLPDAECLSDEQLALIRNFVHAGGGLVATGQSGLYDIWRRRRTEPGLRGLVDIREPGREYEETVGALEVATGLPVFKETGKGRSVYIPGVGFDGMLPEMADYFQIDNRFWKRPKNWQTIIEAIQWASGDTLPIQIDGPEFLAANVVQQREKRRLLIHLVNYNAKNVPSISAVQIRCRLPESQAIQKTEVISPDRDAPLIIAPRRMNSQALLTVPPIRVYSVVVLSW